MTSETRVIELAATEEQMMQLGARFSKAMPSHGVLFLYGDLGAGKTTFTRGFLRGLGWQEKVKSPTYTLVEAYPFGTKQVFHFDLYRLEKPSELEHIGIHDYFNQSSICIVEWPEKGLAYLPAPDVACYITHKDTGREIECKSSSILGKDILQHL